MLLGWPLPLSAAQKLYANLPTDWLPSPAPAGHPPPPHNIGPPPRAPRTRSFTPPLRFLMLLRGARLTFINLSVLVAALERGRPVASCTTVSFVCLVLVEFAKAFAYRSERISTFHRPFANRWLNLAILWETSLLMLVIYLPFLHHPFRTTGLSREE